jgi:hypothetical protein
MDGDRGIPRDDGGGLQHGPEDRRRPTRLGERRETRAREGQVGRPDARRLLEQGHRLRGVPSIGKGGLIVGGAYGRGEVYRTG